MNPSSDPLARPLVFGDKEQAEAVRLLERRRFWKTLALCEQCGGKGACGECDRDCEDCDGLGLPPEEYEKWEKEYPGWCDPERRR